MLGGVLAAAGVVVVVPIAISSSSSTKKTNASGGVEGAAQAGQLLQGIPQNGVTLGKADAPITLTEFADLQCPFCRDYTIKQFPALVAKYVRPGKVKMVFQNYAFIGPDSLTAALAAEGAGKQNKLWQFIDVFYNNQGTENTDYVTDKFLTKIGDGAGVDSQKMLTDRNDPSARQAVAAAQQAAASAGVNSTPTFLLKKGAAPPQKLSADQVEAALAKAAGGT